MEPSFLASKQASDATRCACQQKQARVDRLLQLAGSGSETARKELFEVVYGEPREVAHQLMEDCDICTLQPTALVNEVVLRFLKKPDFGSFANSRVFLSAAISAMERVLIDHYRQKRAVKRGGDRQKVPLDNVLAQIELDLGANYGSLHEALDQLQSTSQRQYDVVRHRFFGGLTFLEVSRMLGVAVTTVERDWRLARAKLYRLLADEMT